MSLLKFKQIQLRKSSGETLDIMAHVAPEKTITKDAAIHVEAGDVFLRTLPSGVVEHLEVAKSSCHEAFGAVRYYCDTTTLPSSTHSKRKDFPLGLAEGMSPVKIFISHSSKDARLAKLLIDVLNESLEIPEEAIRCTSVAGYTLPIGSNASEQLRNELRDCHWVVGLLTNHSLGAPWVMAELGACWGLGRQTALVLHPDLSFSDVQGPMQALHSLKLDNREALHQLIDEVGKDLGYSARSRARSSSAIEKLVSAPTTS